jgi:hypothetical protein
MIKPLSIPQAVAEEMAIWSQTGLFPLGQLLNYTTLVL